jgi:hypothetical protein
MLVAPPSIAGTPSCNRDLAEADRLIHSIRLRETA